MSFLKKLFGGGQPQAAQGVDHAGFTIFAQPQRDGSVYRIAARIERDVDGTTKTHQMIRADTLQDESDAKAASVAKAKQIIDEQGLRIFD